MFEGSAQRRIYRGATVHVGDAEGTVYAPGEVVVEAGRIVYAGPARRTQRGEVIDLTGLHVCPGFIEAHGHLGNLPESFVGESKDLNEMTRPLTPALRAFDAVWPGDVAFAKARSAGVTTVCTLPGSANVLGGLAITLKTAGEDVARMALRAEAGLKAAFGHNVKHSHGIKANRFPLTRMGIAHLFRETFEEALRYEQQRAINENLPKDSEKEVLVRALRRELPLRAHAYRSDDVLTAIRLAQQFGLRLVLEHALEAPLVLEQVVASGAAVVYGPSFRTCGNSEHLHYDFEGVVRLVRAGVKVAVMTDHPIVPIQYLPIQAGLCQRAGLSAGEALHLITGAAADILEVQERVGRLQAGLDADFVVLDGPPLEVASRVKVTCIEGQPVWREGEGIPLPGGALGLNRG